MSIVYIKVLNIIHAIKNTSHKEIGIYDTTSSRMTSSKLKTYSILKHVGRKIAMTFLLVNKLSLNS